MQSPSPTSSLIRSLKHYLDDTLSMLKRAMDECPDEVWTTTDPVLAMWQHAYHSLLGLSIWLTWPSPRIVLPAFHRDGMDEQIGAKDVLSRAVLEGFRQGTYAKVETYFAQLTDENLTEQFTLRGQSFTRADFILGQIRHVQHHVGAMHAHLRLRTGKSPVWI